jgi:tRNA A-37 threonylcarbamoyl transferase component Bud32
MTTPDQPTVTGPLCSTCGAPMIAPFRFCASCGTEANDRCSTCGAEMREDESVCPSCNSPRTRADGTPAPVGTTTWDILLKRLRDGLQGEFKVTRELGRGGQAAVYLADEIALRRQVAIKVLARNSYIDEGTVARFQSEARTIAGFRHQHIVTIYSIRKLGELPFFIMQYLEGRSLAAVLRQDGPMPWSLARTVLYEVGTALHYAHVRGVVHRDIKPANIIFDGEGKAVVTDFGIAKKVADGTVATTTGVLLGTPAYMSPEQCHGEAIGPASDQYGLGIVAYELITGRVPFTGTELVVMHGHSAGAVPPLRELAPDCPPAIEAAVLRMLAKSPNDRFPTVLAALDALGATMVQDDDPVRAALQDIAMHAKENRGRVLTPTFGFAVTGGARYVLQVPAQLQVGESAPCTVALETTNGDRTRSDRVTIPIGWTITPAEAASIDQETGTLTARQAGLVSVRAFVAGQALTAWCQVVIPRPTPASGVATVERPAPDATKARTGTPSGTVRVVVRPDQVRSGTPAAGTPAIDASRLTSAAASVSSQATTAPIDELANAPVRAAEASNEASRALFDTKAKNADPTPSNTSRNLLIGAGAVALGLIGVIVTQRANRTTDAPKAVVDTTTAPTPTAQPATSVDVTAKLSLVDSIVSVGDEGQPSLTWSVDKAARPPATSLRWTSSDTALLKIDSLSGKWIARGAGSVSLSVAVSDNGLPRRLDARTILVSRVAKIGTQYGTTFVNVGDTARVSVTFTDHTGKPIDGIVPQYEAKPEMVLRVDATGLVHGISAGDGRITITAEGRRATIQVKVQEREGTPP